MSLVPVANLDRLVRGGHVAAADAARTQHLWDEIRRLKRDKKAFVPAHNYQVPEVQAIADTVGDSFELAVRARSLDARFVVDIPSDGSFKKNSAQAQHQVMTGNP